MVYILGGGMEETKGQWKIQTLRLNEEDLERLEQVRRWYRVDSRASAMRLLIEDKWKEININEKLG
jgi:hypothetical protein